jgi:Protein of unknown function (DUF3102)
MGTAVAAAAPPLSDLAADIDAHHDLARQHAGQAFDHAVKAGLLLIEAKRQVRHGEWAKWLKANVKVGARQASNYMKVASLPDEKRSAVADLSLRKAVDHIARERGDRDNEPEAPKTPKPKQPQLTPRSEPTVKAASLWQMALEAAEWAGVSSEYVAELDEIDDEIVEAAQAAANAWQKLTNELRKKRVSTLPEVTRVFVKTEPVDETPTRVFVKTIDPDDDDLGDIPDFLQRKTHH